MILNSLALVTALLAAAQPGGTPPPPPPAPTPTPTAPAPSRPAPTNPPASSRPAPVTKPAPANPAPAETKPASSARLEIEKTGIDFGKINDTDLPKAEINFKNTGTDTLIFSGLRPSCGCVRPELKNGKRDYAPGESGTLLIGFEPRGKKSHAEFTVTISTNDGANPNVLFKVEATVKPSIGTIPLEGVNLGKLDFGVEKTATFYVFARDPNFKPTFGTVTGERAFGVTIGKVEPFDLDGEKVQRALVTVTVPAGTKLGRFAEKINIRHNLEQFSAGIEAVAMQGEILHDLRASVTDIKSNTPVQGDYSGEFILSNIKGKDFKITKTWYKLKFGPGVTCNPTFEPTGKPGEYKVKYEGKGGVKPGANRGWLVIEHDLADMPPFTIPVENVVAGSAHGEPSNPAQPSGEKPAGEKPAEPK